MSIQGIKITKDEIRYVFPKSINGIRKFEHIEELKRKLRTAFREIAQILPNFPYRTKYPSPGYTINL
jgi:hypothetical protein